MADVINGQTSSSQFNQNDLPELLNQYYKRLFPYEQYYKWLSYGGGEFSIFPQLCATRKGKLLPYIIYIKDIVIVRIVRI